MRGEEDSVNYRVNYAIYFQTEDAFQPIEYPECKGIDYVRQETDEGCLWHDTYQTMWSREAFVVKAKEVKEEKKRQAPKRKRSARWQKVKRVANVVLYPLSPY